MLCYILENFPSFNKPNVNYINRRSINYAERESNLTIISYYY